MNSGSLSMILFIFRFNAMNGSTISPLTETCSVMSQIRRISVSFNVTVLSNGDGSDGS